MFDQTLFGEAILRLRSPRSQRTVAKKAGIAVGTWCQWEKGKRRPRETQVRKILAGLECSADDLAFMMWTIQTERFRLRGSELANNPLFREPVLLRQQDELADLDLEEIPIHARASMRRMHQHINDLCSVVEPLLCEYAALCEALRSTPRGKFYPRDPQGRSIRHER